MRPEKNITTEQFVQDQVTDIQNTIGDGKILCALSGGVDSSVCAVLAHKAVGNQLVSIFVDTGLMRLGEGDYVEKTFTEKYGTNFVRVNAEERFLAKLKGVTDPEQKRKIIGEEFIRVFEEEAKKLDGIDYFLQGTIYPDVVESGVDSKLVKSHHNVGGLPDIIDFKGIVEPLRTLYKDEVRTVGSYLGMPDEIVNRQPFPGPGLAVRCLGEITKEKLDILRQADHIFTTEIKNAGLDQEIWQYFAVLTDSLAVGIKEERVYGHTVALRAVNSVDAMHATFAKIPYEVLDLVANRITQEIDMVTRVVYDITNKPMGTIEWE